MFTNKCKLNFQVLSKKYCLFIFVFCIVLLLSQKAYSTKLIFAAADTKPTAYSVEGVQKGILVDIINEVFKRAGYDIEIKLLPWARCIEEVRLGRIDGIFSSYDLPERRSFLIFTKEVLIVQEQAFFVRNDSKITFDGDLKKLSNNSIGIITGTSYGPRLDSAIKEGVFKKNDPTSSIESNLRKLIIKRVEIIPSYKHVVLSTAKELGYLDKVKQLKPAIEAIPSYLAFSKNKADYAKIIKDYDTALLSMKKDGTYDAIFSKYLE